MSKPKCFDRFIDCSLYTLTQGMEEKKKKKTTGQSEAHVHKESDRRGSIYKSY